MASGEVNLNDTLVAVFWMGDTKVRSVVVSAMAVIAGTLGIVVAGISAVAASVRAAVSPAASFAESPAGAFGEESPVSHLRVHD
jgi:hypothetical protein